MRKPKGTVLLLLFRAVGDSIISDPSKASFVGLYSRSPVRAPCDSKDAGRLASYFACWVTAKGKLGPWSLPISARVM